ncbi:MAG TPA: tripartite tricarboxylate transporter substrate binding protein [Burkholderiales bacterium]|jgi:tripartite-type tricarboxylate transporter receptor subunit TctC|nr:tripartite tricarboxylate transporter substrate binding protein [Burkholderiales bacterium]
MKHSLIALLAALAATAGLAQEKYPSRPVEMIVPWGAGGGADQLARKLARLMEERVKVSIPVVNVPGATGSTGMTKLVTAPADGYAMAIHIADTHALLATSSPRWKANDFIPLGIMIRQPSALLVKKDSPFKTWNDVVKAAKANPGKLKVAMLGFGSVDDMALKYLEGKGLKFTPVPYAKPGERYTAILGGHTDLLYEQPGDVRSFIDSGQMRPILIFNKERMLPEFADVVCSKEAGLEVYLPQFRSVVVRAGTDPKRVAVLADAVAAAAAEPEFYAFLKESLALRDSFIPAKEAKKFLDGELAAMDKFAAQLKKK